MSIFKNNPNFKLYYSNTDSIIIDKPLPDNLVGTKLGQVKLEHIVKRGIFLAPSASLPYAYAMSSLCLCQRQSNAGIRLKA